MKPSLGKRKVQNNRGSFNDKKFFKETRNIPKPIVNKLISLDGKAGTLIVFHTDCIHMQGIPKEKNQGYLGLVIDFKVKI